MESLKPDIKLKVCGMKYADNLTAISALSPDYLGFIFYPKSQRFMQASLLPRQVKDLPTHIERVGVFVNADNLFIGQQAEAYGLDLIQLHGDETPQQCGELKIAGFRIIKAFGLDETFDFNRLVPYEPFVDFYLFDTKGKSYGGNGLVFNWTILEKYDQHKPFFLSGGIGLEELKEVGTLKGMQIHALDVNSRFEREPGLKDISLIKQLQEQLREDRKSKIN